MYAGYTLFENEKDTTDTIQHIPLSAPSSTRNTHGLAEENYKTLIATGHYALALEKSCNSNQAEIGHEKFILVTTKGAPVVIVIYF